MRGREQKRQLAIALSLSPGESFSDSTRCAPSRFSARPLDRPHSTSRILLGRSRLCRRRRNHRPLGDAGVEITGLSMRVRAVSRDIYARLHAYAPRIGVGYACIRVFVCLRGHALRVCMTHAMSRASFVGRCTAKCCTRYCCATALRLSTFPALQPRVIRARR